MLEDADTRQYLKVGRATPGKLTGRAQKYRTAAENTGRRLTLTGVPYELPPRMSGNEIEATVRRALEAEGHALPWDNTDQRLKRVGPGTPGSHQSSTERCGYRWEGLRTPNPTYRHVPRMRINMGRSRTK